MKVRPEVVGNLRQIAHTYTEPTIWQYLWIAALNLYRGQ